MSSVGQQNVKVKTLLSAANNTGVNVKAAPGQLHGYQFTNTNAAARYVKIFDKATAPTVGTDTPVMNVCVPAGGSVAIFLEQPYRLAAGLGYAVVTGASLTDNTAPAAANDICGQMFYL